MACLFGAFAELSYFCVSFNPKEKMKILHALLLGALLLPAVPTMAQTASGKGGVGKKAAKVWTKAKKSVTDAGHAIGRAVGLENKDDLIRVKGEYYMPLYTVNLYKQDDADKYKTACGRLFLRKYPQADVQTVALPQTDWLSETVEKEGAVVGYLQTMYCYIVARDGTDGYINAKFVFQRYRDVGKNFMDIPEKWPLWERTDVLPMAVYRKLLKK